MFIVIIQLPHGKQTISLAIDIFIKLSKLFSRYGKGDLSAKLSFVSLSSFVLCSGLSVSLSSPKGAESIYEDQLTQMSYLSRMKKEKY